MGPETASLDLPHWIYILFVFALGSCVGSFLNVVVWRLPRVEPVEGEGLFQGLFRSWQALSWPPSHCPKCQEHLRWYDNIPVIGWIKLGGRCRFCRQPISVRYPIVEAIVGLMFVFYYMMFFVVDVGPWRISMTPDGIVRFLPCPVTIGEQWPIYALDMALLAALLAASLIDAELFIIPIEIPWFIVPFALVEHAICDRPGGPMSLNVSAIPAALAAGAAVGLIVSFVFWYIGIFPSSFTDGGPLLEVDKARLKSAGQALDQERHYAPREIRAEMRKEMLFLFPPLALAIGLVWLVVRFPQAATVWHDVIAIGSVNGVLGSVLGLLVGGFVVWVTRILGSYVFGREAMGMGDVHLMLAVGAVMGPGSAALVFFIAPFFGLVWVFYMLIARKGRELPYGPYLSLATAFVMLFYAQIADYLSPGLSLLVMALAG